MGEEETFKIPDAVKKLCIQNELQGFADKLREGMRCVMGSRVEFIELIDERKESIYERLEEVADCSKKTKTVGLNKIPPSFEINNFKSALIDSGSESFLNKLEFKVDTFLGVFFPVYHGSQTRRWSKEDIETAFSEAFCLSNIFSALPTEKSKLIDINTLRFLITEIAQKLKNCDYDAESQYAQLKMAEMQLDLAKSQDAMARDQRRIAESTEKQSRWMTVMTAVVMVATIVTLINSIVSCSTSRDESIAESLQRIDAKAQSAGESIDGIEERAREIDESINRIEERLTEKKEPSGS